MRVDEELIEHAAWIKKYSAPRSFIYRMQLGLRGGLAELFSRKGRDVAREYECDVLFIKRRLGNTVFPRIAEKLDPDIRCAEIEVGRSSKWILNRELITDGEGPLCLRAYRARAAYLIHRFNPKVIVTEFNGSLFSPVLKSVASEKNISVVHLAHSVPTPNYRTFSLIDYHYYIAYGESSHRLLQRQGRVFGDARFVYAGSCHIQERLMVDALPLVEDGAKTFVLLGSGPSIEKKRETKEIYSDVIAVVADQPEAKLLFKPHPRSDCELWKTLVQGKAEQQFKIIESLRQVPPEAIAFCGYTNAIIDVAALGMVPILVCKEVQDDFFYYCEFFGLPAFSRKELLDKVSEVRKQRTAYLKQVAKFRAFHLSDVNDSLGYVANLLCDLVKGNPVGKYVAVESFKNSQHNSQSNSSSGLSVDFAANRRTIA